MKQHKKNWTLKGSLIGNIMGNVLKAMPIDLKDKEIKKTVQRTLNKHLNFKTNVEMLNKFEFNITYKSQGEKYVYNYKSDN